MKNLCVIVALLNLFIIVSCKEEAGSSEQHAVSVQCITGDAEDISDHSATLKGIAAVSGAPTTGFVSVAFYVSDKESDVARIISNGMKVPAGTLSNGGGAFQAVVSELKPETLYFYVASADANGKEFYGEISSFTTLSVEVVEPDEKTPVITKDVSERTTGSALLNGRIYTAYLLSGKEAGFIISTSPNPSISNGQKLVAEEVELDGNCSVKVEGLSSSTTYYYKAYLNLGVTSLTGQVKQFTTLAFNDGSESDDDGSGAVDMGLSVKWSVRNLGADYPEGTGDFFAWGETEPKSYFSEANYKWYINGSSNNLKKYNTDQSYGTVDNKKILDLEDDAACVILGEPWRMPTNNEWSELFDKCTWTPTNVNGKDGLRVTSKATGKSIFLPVTGMMDGSKLSYSIFGYYWFSNVYTSRPITAWHGSFSSNSIYAPSTSYRWHGLSIRPVLGVPATHISLDNSTLKLNIGDIQTLTALVEPSNMTDMVSWHSSNEGVAPVINGVVIATNSGNAKITVTAGSQSATCDVSVQAVSYVPVDLGLSVRWANANLGGYYAWGDTSPKNRYDTSTYKWTYGADFSKYNTADNNMILDPEDDAAHVILVGSWRMPTYDEWTELCTNCTWTWTTRDNVGGYLVTSNKTGNSIFLPANGYRNDMILQKAGSSGYYWSSSRKEEHNYAMCVYFNSGSIKPSYDHRSIVGFTIRPVCE